jgi:7-cyano-7-deazaguanine synthase
MRTKAVILLSGGIDSATTAAIALDRGFELHALIFSYGQRHRIEIESAKKLVAFFSIGSHAIIELPSGIFRSSLTNTAMEVPKNRESGDTRIPDTYVPARNIIFLSYALSFAESIGARHIFIGANAVDYSGYPDCRPDFFRAFQEMADRGTKAGVSGQGFIIETPLIDMTKAEIIQKGMSLGVDYSLTHSCYDPDPNGLACGACDSCLIRKKGFIGAGVPDPTRYRS